MNNGRGILWIIGWWAACAIGAAANETTPLANTFVKNDAGITNTTAYLLVKDQPAFDRSFGHAALMWQKNKTPPPDFTKQVVAFAVHQGAFYTQYKVQSATTTNGVTTIRYTTKTTPTPTTTYVCPMILTLPREGINAIIFVEDGKAVATLKL